MPSRLVILAEEVLFQGGAGTPGRARFDALARLAHAGHPVAVILAGKTVDSATALELQRLAQDSGGQVVAFFHRADHRDDGLSGVLAQVHGVFSRPDDLACVIEHGAIPVALTDHLDARSALPSACRVHANLATFVDALIEEPGPDA
jgi:hypothetical protein